MWKVTRTLLVDGMLVAVVLAAIGIGLAGAVVTNDAGAREAIAEHVKSPVLHPQVGTFDRIRGR